MFNAHPIRNRRHDQNYSRANANALPRPARAELKNSIDLFSFRIQTA